MIPALIIAHANYEAVKKRLTELRSFEIHEIFIYVDGYNDDGNIQRLHQRTQLIEMLEKELSLSKLSRVHFCETNTGVGIAVPSAVDWFFQNVDCGLILEDDCSLQPYAEVFLSQCKQFITTNPNSIVCLSNPNLSMSRFLHASEMTLIPSNFFSSWGWVCHRETWERVSIRKIELLEVLSAVRRSNDISRLDQFWLTLSWMDIWSTLRANQFRLCAFRFTILLITSGVQIYYPSIKLVQHSPNEGSTNVFIQPIWDEGQNLECVPRVSSQNYTVFDRNLLDQYIARNVQGAEFLGLLVRLTHRLVKKMKPNNRRSY